MEKVVKTPEELIPLLLKAKGVDSNDSLAAEILGKLCAEKEYTRNRLLVLLEAKGHKRDSVKSKLNLLNEKGVVEWVSRKNIVYIHLSSSAQRKYTQLKLGVPAAELINELKEESSKILHKLSEQATERYRKGKSVSKTWLAHHLRSWAGKLEIEDAVEKKEKASEE